MYIQVNEFEIIDNYKLVSEIRLKIEGEKGISLPRSTDDMLWPSLPFFSSY